MGEYTRFSLSVSFQPDTDSRVVTLLDEQFNDTGPIWEDEAEGLPDHRFFVTDWRRSIPHFTNGRKFPKALFDPGTGRLEFTCEIKSYEKEIEKFVSWLSPHLLVEETPQKVGWQYYDEGYSEGEEWGLAKDGLWNLSYYTRVSPITEIFIADGAPVFIMREREIGEYGLDDD